MGYGPGVVRPNWINLPSKVNKLPKEVVLSVIETLKQSSSFLPTPQLRLERWIPMTLINGSCQRLGYSIWTMDPEDDTYNCLQEGPKSRGSVTNLAEWEEILVNRMMTGRQNHFHVRDSHLVRELHTAIEAAILRLAGLLGIPIPGITTGGLYQGTNVPAGQTPSEMEELPSVAPTKNDFAVETLVPEPGPLDGDYNTPYARMPPTISNSGGSSHSTSGDVPGMVTLDSSTDSTMPSPTSIGSGLASPTSVFEHGSAPPTSSFVFDVASPTSVYEYGLASPTSATESVLASPTSATGPDSSVPAPLRKAWPL